MNEKLSAKLLLNAKLLELQKSVRALAKNADGYGYQYVSGSKLLYFIRPKMDELGLRLVPTTVSVERDIVETTPADPAKNKPGKYEVLVTLHKSFTWVDCESGESETTDFYAQGCNGWDKSIGSAETYAERYFLLKYFHIATDEDDVDNPKEQPSAPKQETKPEPVKQEPAETAATLDDAIKEANEAKSGKELTAVWNKYKEQYGLDSTFVLAISKNPNNPKKRG